MICTKPFLTHLSELGIGYTFLTNNSSKSTSQYLKHLDRFGIPVAAGQLYSSTHATIEYLKLEKPACQRLFVLGTAGLRAEFADAGFAIAEDSPADEPDAVVVGFDTELVFARLCRAAHWIKRGRPFIATHPDRVCPTNEPTVLVDCGAVCAALASATGRQPDKTLGKPDPCMLTGILRKHQLGHRQLGMVGDRLYTDVAMARAAGCLGVLVLTGEAREDEAASSPHVPDVVVRDLTHLGELLSEATIRPAHHDGRAQPD